MSAPAEVSERLKIGCPGMGPGGSLHSAFGILPPWTSVPAFNPHLIVEVKSQSFSGSVVSNSLRPHRLQHARLP